MQQNLAAYQISERIQWAGNALPRSGICLAWLYALENTFTASLVTVDGLYLIELKQDESFLPVESFSSQIEISFPWGFAGLLAGDHQSAHSDSPFDPSSSSHCWLVGPYKLHSNPTVLPCSHEILRLHARGTNLGSLQNTRHRASRDSAFPIERQGRLLQPRSISELFSRSLTLRPASLSVYASQ